MVFITSCLVHCNNLDIVLLPQSFLCIVAWLIFLKTIIFSLSFLQNIALPLSMRCMAFERLHNQAHWPVLPASCHVLSLTYTLATENRLLISNLAHIPAVEEHLNYKDSHSSQTNWPLKNFTELKHEKRGRAGGRQRCGYRKLRYDHRKSSKLVLKKLCHTKQPLCRTSFSSLTPRRTMEIGEEAEYMLRDPSRRARIFWKEIHKPDNQEWMVERNTHKCFHLNVLNPQSLVL